MSDYYVGQEVVCVDDVFGDGSRPVQRGQHYVVRWVGVVKELDNTLCVRVEGVQRDLSNGDIQNAALVFDLTRMFYPDHEWFPEIEQELNTAMELARDLPMRATRFRPVEKKVNYVEDMKKLLVPQTKVLEEA